MPCWMVPYPGEALRRGRLHPAGRDPAKFELRQVKEKIGGLRVYWRYGDHTKQATLDSQSVRDADIRDRITLAVFEAEARSARRCKGPGFSRAFVLLAITATCKQTFSWRFLWRWPKEIRLSH